MRDGGEAELIRRCLADEPRAWDEFVQYYAGAARSSVVAALGRCGLGGSAQVIEEVVQKVFCECWERKMLADLRDSRLLRPYIASLAACRAIDEARSIFRSRAKRAASDESCADIAEMTPDTRSDPRQRAILAESAEIILREISCLPFKEAFIIRLSVEDDMTHQAIADLVGIPKDTVSTVIRRGREKIRLSLERGGYYDKKS